MRNVAFLRLRTAPASVVSRCVLWRSSAATSSSNPSSVMELVATTGGRQATLVLMFMPSVSICLMSLIVLRASGRSALLTTWMSAISRIPALMA